MSEELERIAEKLFDELEWELSTEESERLILNVLARVRNAALDEAAGVVNSRRGTAETDLRGIAAEILALKEPT